MVPELDFAHNGVVEVVFLVSRPMTVVCGAPRQKYIRSTGSESFRSGCNARALKLLSNR